MLAEDASVRPSVWKGSPSCSAWVHPCDLNGTALDTAVLFPSPTLHPKGQVPSLKPVVEPMSCLTRNFSTILYTQKACREYLRDEYELVN